MLRNYFLVAWRALARHRLYSAINIFGLAVGLASCVVILLYVRDQLSYDDWVPDGDRIYRAEAAYAIPGREIIRTALSPAGLSPTLREGFPDIEAGVRIQPTNPTFRRGTLVTNEELLFTDPSFFDVFDLPFVRGDRRTALVDPTSLVLTESMARKWFGAEDPIGQVIAVTRRGKTRDFRVTAVLRDLPHNTHLAIDFLTLVDPADLEGLNELDLWGNTPVYSYFKLKPGVTIASVLAGLPAYAKRFVPTLSMGGSSYVLAEILKLTFVNLRDVHLQSSAPNQMKATGDARMVSTIAIIALLILLIASINYMNLTTARAGQREREIAMRKVVGATRRTIIVQFLGESVLVASMALVVALALVEVTLPAFNAFLETRLEVHYLGAQSLLPQVAALVLAVGVLGGLYPALYLSRFQPAAALKSSRSSRGSDGSARVRAALVPIQFAIMITLVICTAVVYAQTRYSRSLDMGFDRERLLMVHDIDRAVVIPRSDALAREVARAAGVVGVTRANHVPGDENDTNALVERPGQVSDKANLFERTSIDGKFFEVMGVAMLAGRPLSDTIERDDSTFGERGQLEALRARGINVVIDDRARARLGFASASAALGQPVRVMLPDPVDATVVGVTAGYRFRSTRSPSMPTVFINDRSGVTRLLVRYRGDGPTAMAAVEDAWRRVLPDVPFRGTFMETALAAQYAEDRARARIFAVFAVLAVVIACLGLLGMASFAAERRVREIGVRKVLGATSTQIVTLLLRQFSVPVIGANLLAWPVAFWLMRKWLEAFVLRVDLNPGYFVGAGLAALVVAWLTVGGHAYKVARSSPVEALRYE